MKARVEREWVLRPDGVGAGCGRGGEDEVPAAGRDGAGDPDEVVPREQGVAEGLLAGARDARPQPVGVGNGGRVHDVNGGRAGDGHRRQHVGHGSHAAFRKEDMPPPLSAPVLPAQRVVGQLWRW